jgi:GH25 family lysozyme M1 (1,4-beta-N-acetylmuramidase)
MLNASNARLFDCSHHQGEIDFAKVAAAGYGGVIIKITEGGGSTAFVDPQWIDFYAGAGAVGLARGAYHFADLGNAAAEADHFATVASTRHWELLPVGDIEKAGATASWTRSWMAGVRARLGNPWLRIYSSYSLLTHAMNPSGWYDAHTSIWAARYNTTLGWDHAGLELWQNTDAATIPGVLGHVDTEAAQHGWHIGVDLARMGVTVSPPPPVTPPAPAPHPITGKLPPGTLLRQGSSGAGVVALQRALNTQYPAYSKLKVDGLYGPATVAVVKEFQQRSHLAVDGIAGPITLARLHLV